MPQRELLGLKHAESKPDNHSNEYPLSATHVVTYVTSCTCTVESMSTCANLTRQGTLHSFEVQAIIGELLQINTPGDDSQGVLG